MKRSLPVFILLSLVFVVFVNIIVAWLIPHIFVGVLLVSVSVALAGAFYTKVRLRAQQPFFFPLGMVILSFFLVFLTSGGPFWRDSGEIASAIWSLGVAHPTGFPAIMIAGKSFALLPLGNAFFRINLFETFSLVLVGVMISLLLGMMFRRQLQGAIVGITGFLLSATVLMHGMNTEVYIPSVLGLSVGLAFFVFAFRMRDSRAFVTGAFVLGLGLGGHISWPLNLGVAALVLVIAALIRDHRQVPIVPMVVAGLSGMLIVLYLPAVAGHSPARNWGDPSTLSTMLAHITGSSIRHSFKGEIGGFNWPRFRIHLKMFIRQVSSDQFVLFPLAMIGLWKLIRRGPVIALALVAALVSDVIFTAQINPMGIIDRQTGVTTELVIAIFAGIGTIWLLEVLLDRLRAPRLVSLVVLVFPLVQWAAMPVSPWYNRIHGPQMVISDALDTAKNNCTLLTSSDDLSGLLVAGRVVEERRPDCLHLVKQLILLPWHVDYEFKRAGRTMPWLNRAPYSPRKEAISRMVEVVNKSYGPVYFEPGQPAMDRALPGHLEPGYPMYLVVHDKFNTRRAFSRTLAKAVLVAKNSLDVGKRAVSGFLTGLSIIMNKADYTSDAIRASAIAVRISPTNERALYNRAVLAWWYEQRKQAAIRLLQQAVALRPDYVRALKTLAKYAAKIKDPAIMRRARQQYQAVTGQNLP